MVELFNSLEELLIDRSRASDFTSSLELVLLV